MTAKMSKSHKKKPLWHKNSAGIIFPVHVSNDVKLKTLNKMSLIKYNPRSYATQGVSRFFDDLFNDRFFNHDSDAGSSFIPQVDISETEKSFELQFAVPGLDKKDLNIDLNDGVLTVSGERKFQNETNEKNYHSVETRYGSFKRSFQLPDNVNADKVDANYDAGILNVVIPKDEKKIQKRTIAVK